MDQNIRIQPPLWLPILVAVLVGGAYVGGKFVETRDTQPLTITVSGKGEVTAVPDIASLQFGVTTGRVASAEEAMNQLAEKMDAAIEAVKSHDIEEKDITTQNLYLNPSYDWVEGERIDRGFEATQNLYIKVRDTEKVGAILTSVARAGANQIGSVNFTIDDPEDLQAEAREKAIENAKEKAEELASQLGMTIVGIEGFSEGYNGAPTPMYSRAMMDEAMEGGVGGGADVKTVSVPSGEQEVSVNVSITYKLK